LFFEHTKQQNRTFAKICVICGLFSLCFLWQKNQLQGKSLILLIEGKNVPKKLYAAGRYGAGDTIVDRRFRYSEFRAKAAAVNLFHECCTITKSIRVKTLISSTIQKIPQ
jgi:hypothetical protein